MQLLKTLWQKQWPFWLGGLFVGLAEIIFYYHYDMFIVVTTGLAQMFAVAEVNLFGVDWVARVYEPGIYWFIVFAIVGARMAGIAEKDHRDWVHYDGGMLALAFIGGFLFSFGTRIAGGCTTHHFLGGIPSMSIASWVVLLSGIPFAFLAFKLVTGLGKGGYLRHQETWCVSCEQDGAEHNHNPGYKPGYKPWKNPLHLGLTCLLLGFLLVPLYYGLTSDIAGSISQIGWGELAWLAAPGLLLGFGIAKTGFGTECSAMAPESAFTSHDFYRKNGVPDCTYRMFRGMLPLQGLMVSIVILNLFIVYSWIWGEGTIPNASGDEGLYWGHILGGPLLAMGAVLMIGCEVRTYARLGLGYSTALAALPGFYLGYLPYTLYQETIDEVVFGEGLTEYITFAEWASDTFGASEQTWAFVYSGLMIAILLWTFAAARRFLRLRARELLVRNTDQLVYAPGGS
ncbi:MAG: YeeE/YedE family protein [Candidatus Thiodiazotropha lotti]|uniref:YeeE/YedE family protein n=1 Tax=Candidatus Thiodiazotropha lotti TaxID=2792787 RepID=A0A9E4N0M5_9GAMM|nr:YeeE/YedE family protein [Candidatus Thiodiazotropha lotti]MCW4203176.1 YeeE/YedE family protein [Candidatus Thiodiazotropha lotti]